MRSGFLQIVLVSSLLASTGLLAQHAGSAAAPHMGTAGHGSPGVSRPTRSLAPPAGASSPNRSAQVGRTGHWPSWNGGSNYRSNLRQRYPYQYPGLLSFGYGFPGYGAGYDDGDLGGAPQAGPAQEYGPQPPEAQMADNGAPFFRPAYQGPADAPARPQPATTLIFKDGRPEKQVHNYALTGTTLWDLDGDTREEISLAVIDVPATVKTNRDAGVDFALPSSR